MLSSRFILISRLGQSRLGCAEGVSQCLHLFVVDTMTQTSNLNPRQTVHVLRRLHQLHEPRVHDRPVGEAQSTDLADSLVAPFRNVRADKSREPAALRELGCNAVTECLVRLASVSLTPANRVGEIVQVAQVLEADAKQPFWNEPTDPSASLRASVVSRRVVWFHHTLSPLAIRSSRAIVSVPSKNRSKLV